MTFKVSNRSSCCHSWRVQLITLQAAELGEGTRWPWLRVRTASKCESRYHLHSHDPLRPRTPPATMTTERSQVCWRSPNSYIIPAKLKSHWERGLTIACTWFTPQGRSRDLGNDLWLVYGALHWQSGFMTPNSLGVTWQHNIKSSLVHEGERWSALLCNVDHFTSIF